MLWVIISYIPAKAWRFLFAYSSVVFMSRLGCSGRGLESFDMMDVLLSTVVCFFWIARPVADWLAAKEIRQRALETRGSPPEQIDASPLVEYFLRLRIAGVAIASLIVVLGTFAIVTMGMRDMIADGVMLIESLERLLFYLLLCFICWLAIGIIIYEISLYFDDNWRMGEVAGVALIALILPLWILVFVYGGAVGMAILLLMSFIVLPLGCVTIGLLVLAVRLLNTAGTRGIFPGESRYDRLSPYLGQVARQRMTFAGEGLRRERPYLTWKNRPVGAFLALVMVFAVLLIALAWTFPGLTLFGPWVLLISFPLLALAYYFLRLSRRLRQQSAEQVLRADPRPPVLVLRAFRDDGLTTHARAALLDKVHLQAVATAWCARVGPVVALGRPGEFLPHDGPPRRYVPDDEWRAQILTWMRTSRLLIVIVGRGEQLAWEMRQIVEGGYLHKTVLVLPPTRPRTADTRWRALLRSVELEPFARPGWNRGVDGKTWDCIASLRGVDPTRSILVAFDRRRAVCIESRVRNTLAYDMAFNILLAQHPWAGSSVPDQP